MTNLEEYRLMHRLCPKCYSNDITKQTIGILRLGRPGVRDTNAAWCVCGWQGISHDLVGERGDDPLSYPCPICKVVAREPCLDDDGVPSLVHAFHGGRITGSTGPIPVQHTGQFDSEGSGVFEVTPKPDA